MKILVANFKTKGNRFLPDLNRALSNYAEVVWDVNQFWSCSGAYDVVHLHWPEFLSYDIQNYLYTSQAIPNELWLKLEKCLKFWQQQAVMVITRHNQLPHLRQDETFMRLYQLVMKYCDKVIHFAHYSIKQFKEWYPKLQNVDHAVIPHHNYDAIPNPSHQQAAREKLQINKNATVMLVFGTIYEQEKKLIKKAFDFIPNKNKVLLAPSWKVNRRNISYIRLREWVWKFEKWLAQKNKTTIIDKGFIREEEAHYYINAGDFIFIPRQIQLNSGNIALGFTFGKVVVGRQDGNIGEILQQYDNPVFEVGNDESLKKAIKHAIRLSKSNQGFHNYEIATKNWHLDLIAQQYIKEMNASREKKWA